jgi:peroxiredoxin
MKKKATIPILVFIFTFLAFITTGAQEKEGKYTEIPTIKGIEPLANGEPAPLFSIEDINGDAFALESFKDKNPVLLFFWSFFCGPCREEIPMINQITAEYKEKGLIVAGVNLDGKEMKKAISKFMEQEKISYIVAFDELNGDSFKVADPFGVAGTPSLFLIDKKGILTFSKVGAVEHDELKGLIENVLE